MAGIDKQYEFYQVARRFAFLSSFYRPENLPENINQAMEILVKYFGNDVTFCMKVEEADEWFEDANKQLELLNRKYLLSELIKECCK